LGLLDDPAHRVDTLWAAGFTGSVAAVHRCVQLLDDGDEVGPLAGEAMQAIVGLPADDLGLWRDRAKDQSDDVLPALCDDNLESVLSLRPVYFLPLPEPDAIRSWWTAHEARFDSRCR